MMNPGGYNQGWGGSPNWGGGGAVSMPWGNDMGGFEDYMKMMQAWQEFYGGYGQEPPAPDAVDEPAPVLNEDGNPVTPAQAGTVPPPGNTAPTGAPTNPFGLPPGAVRGPASGDEPMFSMGMSPEEVERNRAYRQSRPQGGGEAPVGTGLPGGPQSPVAPGNRGPNDGLDYWRGSPPQRDDGYDGDWRGPRGDVSDGDRRGGGPPQNTGFVPPSKWGQGGGGSPGVLPGEMVDPNSLWGRATGPLQTRNGPSNGPWNPAWNPPSNSGEVAGELSRMYPRLGSRYGRPGQYNPGMGPTGGLAEGNGRIGGNVSRMNSNGTPWS
ncbi:MAG TPA: hypothetical protein VNA25_29400 [Phycisphaerae bacterium]|nr:hypothetical protein [Phycisphaerae bacterium]